jgi:uncharacterized protein
VWGRIVTSGWVRGIALVLLCVVLAGVARGDTVFPVRTGHIVDEAGLLSQQSRNRLERQLIDHERTTTNQVMVVTVRSLQGMQIEAYTLALANKWAVGQAGRNNGIVLLVAPNERQVRIEVGIGLERHLTNAMAAHIIERRMLPAFRAGRQEDGIRQGVDSILAALSDNYQMTERSQWSPQADQPGGRQFGMSEITVLAGIVLIIIIFNNLPGVRSLNRGSGRRNTWRSDDDDSSFSSSTGGGGSFRGGGASGRW